MVDNGTTQTTIVLPTGSYGIEGSNDIGQALVTLINAALPAGDFKSSYNEITNHYTFTSSGPFRFLWPGPAIADQLGFPACPTLPTIGFESNWYEITQVL